MLHGILSFSAHTHLTDLSRQAVCPLYAQAVCEQECLVRIWSIIWWQSQHCIDGAALPLIPIAAPLSPSPPPQAPKGT